MTWAWLLPPMVYFGRVHYGIKGAVMVTAYYNPLGDNGFQVSGRAGNALWRGDRVLSGPKTPCFRAERWREVSAVVTRK